jgi:GTPase
MKKPQVIVINKIDIPTVQEKVSVLITQLRFVSNHARILPISAVMTQNVKQLMQ